MHGGSPGRIAEGVDSVDTRHYLDDDGDYDEARNIHSDPAVSSFSTVPIQTDISTTRKVFNFVIVKISATTEITEFREIRPKFHRNFFRD